MARYGWTLDYILWEISYLNMIMLVTDIVSVYSNLDIDNNKESNQFKSNKETHNWFGFLSAMKKIKGYE
ncbi:MAG: hypothetical protein ACK5MH_09070 [Bacteroidales bacterium]